jgi:hypothetical protein
MIASFSRCCQFCYENGLLKILEDSGPSCLWTAYEVLKGSRLAATRVSAWFLVGRAASFIDQRQGDVETVACLREEILEPGRSLPCERRQEADEARESGLKKLLQLQLCIDKMKGESL